MNALKLGQLLSDFSQKTDSLKGQMSQILSLIAEEKVPSKQEIDRLVEAVNSLQIDYDSIRSLAKDVLCEVELPPDGSSVREYAIAIEAFEKDHIEKKLESISAIIMRFISVRSFVTTYAEALAPYQTKAALMFEELKGISKSPIPDAIIEESTAHQLFLDALSIEDFGNDQAITLLDAIDKIYPSRVQVGLAQKQYFVLDDTTASETDPDKKNDAETIHTQDIVSKGQPFHSPDSSIGTKLEQKAESTDISMLISKFRIKNAKPSASAFKSDIFNMPKTVRTLLPLFTNLGALTASQATCYGVCMNCFPIHTETESIKNALDRLASKGYVTAYESDLLQETIYCLSQLGYGSMHKETIASKKNPFWTISYGDFKLIGSEQIIESDIIPTIKNNALLLTYIDGIQKQVPQAEYSKIKSSIKWVHGHYQLLVYWEGQQYLCRIHDTSLAWQSDIGENLLFVAAELPEVCTSDSYSVFAYVNTILYHLDGDWVECSPSDAAQFEASSSPDDPVTISLNPLSSTIHMDELPSDALTDQKPRAFAQMPNIKVSTPSLDEKGSALLDDNVKSQVKEPNCTTTAIESSSSIERIEEILNSSRIPSDMEFASLVYSLLNTPVQDNVQSGKNLKNAAILSKAASYIKDNRASEVLYQQLAFATHLFPADTDYSGMAISSLFPDYHDHTEGMMLSTYMIALLSPCQKHDYILHSQARAYHDDYETIFPSYPFIKPLFHKLIDIDEVAPEGFSDSILGLLGDAAEKATFAKSLQDRARDLLNIPTIKAKMSGLPELCSSCFGSNSDLYLCMDIVANDRDSDKEYVSEVLSEYSLKNAVQLSLIGQRIDKQWSEATKGKRTNKLQLSFLARSQVEDAFKKRLSLMITWLEHVDNRDDKRLAKLKSLKAEILQLLATVQNVLTQSIIIGNDRIVSWSLEYMRQKLSGEERSYYPFSHMLFTGNISLDDEWNPILDPSMTTVKYYEPWRNVLRHITASELSYEQIMESVFDPSSQLFDNLHQLEMLGRLRGENPDQYVATEADHRGAIDSAEEHTKKFTDKLEMAYTYNRIDETDRENLLNALARYKEPLFLTKDFGNWRSFLGALEQQVDEISESRKKELRSILSAKKATTAQGTAVPLLDEAESLLEKDCNYAVAEEYINRFDNGEVELSDELSAVLHDVDSFSDFISDKVFQPIHATCTQGAGRLIKSFGAEFLDKHMPRDWTTRLRESSKRMLETWPVKKGSPSTASQLCDFFKCIGLRATKAEKIPHQKVELYHLHASKLPRNQADYMHPISAFGTQLKSPLSVVVLFGNYTAKQLVDTITSLNLGGMVLVVLDGVYDLSMRRQMAEIFRTETSRQNPFLLIDQVLLLYLAMHQETERLPVMMKCTLPGTTYQPFVRDGGSTADEMFCGRTRELFEIMNPGGACFVYGGRQLGKTALLERAESRCLKPESREYAVYSNIIDCHNESVFVRKIMEDINKKTNLTLSQVETIRELCQQLDSLLRSGKVVSMLLLFDEADNFFQTIGHEHYTPLQPLIDLKRESKNAFKFVFAGLHNVCRSQNATANNGVFGQLGTPLCIKPLSPTDALLLISRPLRYLGFQIDQYPHLETILTNTNYYPGILQFFGYTLVQTFNNHYAKYYRATESHPPFTLRDEQFGSVMNSADLNRSIRDKFRLSLELDPRYFMIARCITMLNHLDNEDLSQGSLGFTVDQIKSFAEMYSIHCLSDENVFNYITLLDEMVDMGILSKPTEETYRLRRRSFINIIGSDMNKLEDEIVRTNEEQI